MLSIWLNKKAITPVLSTVLLTVITVAGMSIALTATYVITGNLKDTMGERFIIEDVWFRPNAISIYLRNTGKTALDIAAIYINHESQSITTLHLEPLAHNWLNTTYAWSPNTVYHVNIATSRGTQVAEYYTSP